MTQIKNVLAEARQTLTPSSSSASLDAEVLLAFCLKKNRSYLFSHGEDILSPESAQLFAQLLEKRKEGWPIAYLVGEREFWSLPLKVTPETLIPRPETELLVELILDFYPEKSLHVLDLGTGSGAIALALAKERPSWHITATDASLSALAVAKENADKLGIHNVCFLKSDWFTELDLNAAYDIIVANPPYIAENDPHLREGDLRFEPQTALVAASDGLAALRIIIEQGFVYLKPNGRILLEHGYDQKLAIASIFKERGYQEIKSWRDWQNNDRVSGARRIEVEKTRKV